MLSKPLRLGLLTVAVLAAGVAFAQAPASETPAEPEPVSQDQAPAVQPAADSTDVGLSGRLVCLDDKLSASSSITVQTEKERFVVGVRDLETIRWQLGRVRKGFPHVVATVGRSCPSDRQAVGSPSAVQVELDRGREGDELQLQRIALTGMPVSQGKRLLALAIGAVVLLLVAILFAGRRAWQFIVGEDNRFSNSKLQLAMWFGILIATYLGTVWLRFVESGYRLIGGVGIPENLLLLSGLSALTFAGAKGVTESKLGQAKKEKEKAAVEAEVAEVKVAAAEAEVAKLNKAAAEAEGAEVNKVAAEAAVAKVNKAAAEAAAAGAKIRVGQAKKRLKIFEAADRPRFLQDLTFDKKERPDFGDFQMLVVALIAVGVYLVQVFEFLAVVDLRPLTELPDVDGTILATFGLGQGAYLAKKYVGGPAE